MSDEVFGDTGGSSGDEMVNDWKREVVEAAISSSASVAAAAAASSSSTGFSKGEFEQRDSNKAKHDLTR